MLIRKDKVDFFEQTVADFFHKAGREHLPWRKKNITAYEVWVSEIMLQQTQVSRVIAYYTRFLERFPTLETLAQATWEEFLPYYEGLGYYARGRNMLKAAVLIMEKYQGIFPQDRKALENIPGIGPYTAAAILSFAYGQQIIAWDTNLRRVIGRFFFGSKRVADVYDVEDRLTLAAPELNAALMDLGSSLCTGRPKCGACPLAARCRYRREKGVGESVEKEIASSSVDWSRAKTYIVLHEGHREYLSSRNDRYQPFILPKGYASSRSGIKDWFLRRFGLSVSVRPPKKDMRRGVILVNVQILSGKASFPRHEKKAFVEFLDQ
ncbi:MAG: A/G-specific adenine glycosylase [Candidatus Moranbacteria bacterium]|nr:A/G-specific adenine glycosylase [Candidatus Moranbacteria bacterium]MBP6034455.1 A/G-specific adenine glycosylase [Candidatus Moranbacteria bacterium]MBP7696091.1 A/G-specific adenine glycosylase [Candidatus Moranbacteria bacterium]